MLFLYSTVANKMLAALLLIEPEKVYAMPDPSLPVDEYKLLSTLTDLVDRELVATIGWAKQVPGKLVVDVAMVTRITMVTDFTVLCVFLE